MKHSNEAWIWVGFLYGGAYIFDWLNWGNYSQYTDHQLTVQVVLVSIMFFLYFILREIEDFKESDSE